VVKGILSQLSPEDELIVVSPRKPEADREFVWVPFDNGGCDPTTGATLSTQPGYPSGGPERDAGRAVAKGTHLMCIDDDDLFLPDALSRGRLAAAENPTAWHIFRMQYGVKGQWTSPDSVVVNNERVMWGHEGLIRLGNIGGSMYVMPNSPLLKWDRSASNGVANISEDFWVMHNYHQATGCPVVWHPEIISIIKPTREQIMNIIGVDVPELRYARQFQLWDGVPQ
jgi:hypothetical protein